MAKTSLGKVAILPRGEYSSIENYKRLDIVTYNGSSYLCLQDCTGIDVTNAEYWQILAEKGDKGDTGAKGDKGEKGDTGKDFSIYKTYPSINDMNADAPNVPEGEFVLIASSVEDEDNAKLYVKNSTGFVYLTDLSGATGIKGEKGDKPINGVDYNTPEEKEEFKNEVVEDATTEVKQNIATIKEQAIQDFNTNASTKTTAYDTNANAKLTAYNDNATQKTTEYNTNATSKVNEFNTNASTKTTEFDTNAINKTNDFNSNASTKTDEFNTNYEEKLESINEASTSIEQERVISDGKYARALKTQVKDAQQAQIYAENDIVDDLVIKGTPLTQKTREGYNLVDFKSPDEIYASDFNFQNDILTVTSSSGTFRQIIYDITNLMLTNAGKVLSFWYSNVDFSQGKSPSVQITLIKNDNTKSYTQLLSASLVKSNFNIPDNISEYSSLKLGILCNNTSESSNASITITKPMLLIGTEEKPYEEYGASPSLDYPSEIEVADEQKILICRKNLIKSFKFDDSNLDNYGWILRIEAPIKPNTTYTIGIKGAKDNKYYLSEEWIVGGGTEFTVTMTGNMQYITFTTKSEFNKAAYNSSQGGYILLKNRINQPNAHIFEDIILAEGTVNEAYQPYEGQDISILLQNLAINKYSDIIDRNNKNQNKFIQELTLTGDENWSLQTSPNRFDVYNVPVNALKNAQLCTHFKTYNEYANAKGTFALGGNYIRVYNDNNMTLEEWKAFLAQQNQAGTPVKFYYVAVSSTTNPLPQEVQTALSNFKLYQDLNNVAIDSGSMSFIYNKSLPKVIEEMQDEIQSKDTLIQNLTTRVEALEKAQIDNVTENLGGN